MTEALKVLGHDWVEIDILATNYTLPKPNNLSDFREDIRKESDWGKGDGPLDDFTIARWLISNAIQTINFANPRPEFEDTDAIEFGGTYDDSIRLTARVEADDLKLNGQPLILKQKLPDLFNPQTGKWRENIRSYDRESLADTELFKSMQQFGWLPEFPAIKDENGVILVGHRRLDVAEMLNITPVVRTVHYGEGEAADARRTRVALGSNLGAEKISPADRKKIAEELALARWTLAEIGNLLRVSTMTVSRDLRGLTGVKLPERGGRPRKQEPAPEPVSKPVPEPVAEPVAEPVGEPVGEPVAAPVGDQAEDQAEDQAPSEDLRVARIPRHDQRSVGLTGRRDRRADRQCPRQEVGFVVGLLRSPQAGQRGRRGVMTRRCPCPDKARYPTRGAALVALRGLPFDRLYQPVRAYRCGGHWHLTAWAAKGRR